MPRYVIVGFWKLATPINRKETEAEEWLHYDPSGTKIVEFKQPSLGHVNWEQIGAYNVPARCV